MYIHILLLILQNKQNKQQQKLVWGIISCRTRWVDKQNETKFLQTIALIYVETPPKLTVIHRRAIEHNKKYICMLEDALK